MSDSADEDGSVPGYASRTATNLLLALLCVTVAAGFTGAEPVVNAVLYGVPALAALIWVMGAAGHARPAAVE